MIWFDSIFLQTSNRNERLSRCTVNIPVFELMQPRVSACVSAGVENILSRKKANYKVIRIIASREIPRLKVIV